MTDPLDLDALSATVSRPDAPIRRAVQDKHAGRPGSRGRLDDLAAWLAAVQESDPPRPLERVRLVVLATGAGDTEPDVAGLAAALGVTVRVVDVPDVPDGGELTREQADAALAAGMAVADEEVDAGADLLVLAVAGADVAVPAQALVGLLTHTDASAVTSRGAVIDDASWMVRCAAVRDTMRRGRPVLGDKVGLLAAVGGAGLATATGLLVQAAARRTPVVLDGELTAGAALVAQRIAFRASDWWVAGHRSPEPAHALALDRLDLEPLLDLGIRDEDGTGALLAVPVIRAAAAAG
jgi:nicotinate-nucleotide--dimethylbenzimidazole phosphoribosyltransferase